MGLKDGCWHASPRSLLTYMTCLSLLIYIDRGVLPALIHFLKSDSDGLGLSDT